MTAYSGLMDEWIGRLDAAAKAHAELQAKRRSHARFYQSRAWRALRYRCLSENAKRNSGKPLCELCGAGAEPGKPLNCDHIEPISRNWRRRLDPTNVQCLCVDCNMGKSNHDDMDFRPGSTTDAATAALSGSSL